MLIMAVPTHAFRQILVELAPHTRPWIPVVSLSKGFEEGTHKRMTELIEEELPGHPAGALSGPNLAKEVLKGRPQPLSSRCPTTRSPNGCRA